LKFEESYAIFAFVSAQSALLLEMFPPALC
jgi:hypothetical protein